MKYANGEEVQIGDTVKMACDPNMTFGFFPGQDRVVGFHSSTCVEVEHWHSAELVKTYLAALLVKV